MISGKVSEDELFYSSIKESFKIKDEEVYGATHYITGDVSDDYAYCEIVGNKLEEFITRVTLINEDGEEMVKDWNQETEFKMVKWYKGKCIIEYAKINNPEDVKIIELDAKGFY